MRVVDVVQSAVKLFILEKRKQWAIIGWPSWCCGKIITTHTHTRTFRVMWPVCDSRDG